MLLSSVGWFLRYEGNSVLVRVRIHVWVKPDTVTKINGSQGRSSLLQARQKVCLSVHFEVHSFENGEKNRWPASKTQYLRATKSR